MNRARAEYIKSHSRAERVLAVWKITSYIAGYLETKACPDVPQDRFLIAEEYMRDMQYDIFQLNVFCEFVRVRLTAPVLHRFARNATSAFYLLELYIKKVCPEGKVWFLAAIHVLPPIKNGGATLRAAFLEAEHALITLPRTHKPVNTQTGRKASNTPQWISTSHPKKTSSESSRRWTPI